MLEQCDLENLLLLCCLKSGSSGAAKQQSSSGGAVDAAEQQGAAGHRAGHRAAKYLQKSCDLITLNPLYLFLFVLGGVKARFLHISRCCYFVLNVAKCLAAELTAGARKKYI